MFLRFEIDMYTLHTGNTRIFTLIQRMFILLNIKVKTDRI